MFFGGLRLLVAFVGGDEQRIGLALVRRLRAAEGRLLDFQGAQQRVGYVQAAFVAGLAVGLNDFVAKAARVVHERPRAELVDVEAPD
jgi:hypothetical protein